ncbi:MAG: SRPBCC family protein [Mucilaginibacter sp.]|uniref:SRPBCC family protein n=1 Tax=Mucilaginibacter sp. TaxID=1882438 RepID=UPI003267448E
MSIVIIIIGIIVGLVVLLLIIAAFSRKDYAIERQIVINKPQQEVFDFIKYLKNQDHYNKWWTMDPDAKKDYKGIDGTVGFIAYWDSQNKQAGQGEQEIKKITDSQRLDTEIRFIRPFAGIANIFMTTDAITTTQTKVTWGMSGAYKYPMNIMLVIMKMDKLLGGDLEISLSRLKDYLEK